jgi:mercuric ion binding protein
MKPATIVIVTLLISASAAAAPRSVTLDVPGMNCAACPITVKKALIQVAGVQKVEVSYERREAVVNFDDAKVATPRLMQATADAGYPSIVKTTAQ